MMSPRYDRPCGLAVCIFVAILGGLALPVAAQSPGIEPTYADGVIQCPDGSTHEYTLGVPDTLVLHLACQSNLAGAQAAIPTPIKSDDLSSLRRPISDGTLHCPDGSTRPWEGKQPNDLVVKMTCAVPADVAAENHRRVQMVVDQKNKEGRLRAALRGEAGIWEGLKASWEARSPDYLLSFRATWLIGIGLLVVGLARIFGKK